MHNGVLSNITIIILSSVLANCMTILIVVVAPSTIREDEYVTMRPAAMRHVRDRQANEQRQPLMNTNYDAKSEDDDDGWFILQQTWRPVRSGR